MWNLRKVQEYTSTIINIPSGIRASNWFGFTGGYNVVSYITPGFAYWVKTNSNGKFVLNATDGMVKSRSIKENILDKLNTITISDAEGNIQTLYFGVDNNEELIHSLFEMPPLPPEGIFDARFQTAEGGFILQTHPDKVEETLEYPIQIRAVTYPITISWKVIDESFTYELADGVSGKLFNPTEISSEGTKVIKQANLVILRVLNGKVLPTRYELEQNFPNPFNPTTTIKFSIAKEVKVNLNIYNILGEKVKELKNEVMKPGYYDINFDASTLASGVYLYRIQAGDFIQTKKMILLK